MASVGALRASARQAFSAAYGSLCPVPDELPLLLFGGLEGVEGVSDGVLVLPTLLDDELLGELCAA